MQCFLASVHRHHRYRVSPTRTRTTRTRLTGPLCPPDDHVRRRRLLRLWGRRGLEDRSVLPEPHACRPEPGDRGGETASGPVLTRLGPESQRVAAACVPGPGLSAAPCCGGKELQHLLHHPAVRRRPADLGAGGPAACRPGAAVGPNRVKPGHTGPDWAEPELELFSLEQFLMQRSC